MEFKLINQTLEKYFEGETSLAEEAQLRAFFNNGKVPTEYEKFRPLFAATDDLQKNSPSENFTDVLLDRLENEKGRQKKRQLWTYVSRIAAVFLLCVMSYFAYQQTQENVYASNLEVDTHTNPEEAYQDAKDALILVSSKLFKSKQAAEENLAKLDALNVALPNN